MTDIDYAWKIRETLDAARDLMEEIEQACGIDSQMSLSFDQIGSLTNEMAEQLAASEERVERLQNGAHNAVRHLDKQGHDTDDIVMRFLDDGDLPDESEDDHA